VNVEKLNVSGVFSENIISKEDFLANALAFSPPHLSLIKSASQDPHQQARIEASL
jgi:hypothetical protein